MIFDNVFGTSRSEKELQKVMALMMVIVGTLCASVKGVDVASEIHNGAGYEAHKWAVGQCKEAFKKVDLVPEGDKLTAAIDRRSFDGCVQAAESDFKSSTNFAGYAGAAFLALGGLMAYDATYLRGRRKDSIIPPAPQA